MNKEKWIQWKPIEGLDTVYEITEVINNSKGFAILMKDSDNDTKKVRVLFKEFVNAYRYTDESYRLNISSLFTQPNGKNLYGIWGFFKATNSTYLHWLEEES